MKAFLAACVATIVIAVVASLVLTAFDVTSAESFASGAVRL